MRANVIHAATPETFDYMLFPESNPLDDYYLRQQLSQISGTLSDVGQRFMGEVQNLYDRVNDSTLIRKAKAALKSAKALFHPNEIVPLETLDELRDAHPRMQRFAMANPYIREQYHKQLCDGYSEMYKDYEPGVIGEKHYDYRRMMTGVIQEVTDENGEDTWVARQYWEDLKEGDRELTGVEKCIILRTNELAEMFLRDGKDPTDMFAKR